MPEQEKTTLEETREYKVSPISPEPEAQSKRGWTLEINGHEIDQPISSVILKNKRIGVEVDYGQRQEGFDGPVLKEPGGGGAVTIPYYFQEGELYIGVVEESRPTCTDGGPEKVLNVPRGFLDPGQTHFETAKKELEEETGYTPLPKRIKELKGQPMNPNSTFFVTGKDKGIRMFGVQVYDFELTNSNGAENPMDREYVFDEELIKPTSKMGEKFLGANSFIGQKQFRKLTCLQ